MILNNCSRCCRPLSLVLIGNFSQNGGNNVTKLLTRWMASSNSKNKEISNNKDNKTNLPRSEETNKQFLTEYRFPEVPRDPVSHSVLANIKQDYHGVEQSSIGDNLLWYPIFRFPYTLHLVALSKIKLFLTGLTSYLSITGAYYFLLNPSLSLLFPVIGSTLTLASLMFIGNLYRRFVCQIYTTGSCELIRISRLTFFGKRLDMILPVSSILPVTTNNESLRRSFIKLQFIKPEEIMEDDREEFYEEYFRFCLVYGGVCDIKRFEKALGRLLTRKVTVV